MDQKLTMLAKVPLFAGLSSHDLEAIGRLVDEVDVREGKVLAKEGAPGHEFFVILDGTVAISKGDKYIRDLGAGDHFGELAMIAQVPRTATATAKTPARLLVLGHREFATLLADRPEIREKVLREVAMWISQNSPTPTH
ncbi:MAG TPA: cyclic nucleotide-binding domain-containing protein [Candidatus Limnocylindrales bacterium]|nr:cyclic nucleotide-binding domain-containing protein [Candidatus Limnocylindrales bacterium]